MKTCFFKNKLISETSVETIDLSPKIGVNFFKKKEISALEKWGQETEKKCVYDQKKCMYEQKKCMYLNEIQIQ